MSEQTPAARDAFAKAMKWNWVEEDRVYYCSHGDCVWYGVCQEPDIQREYHCKPAGSN